MRHSFKKYSWLLGLLLILSGYTEKAAWNQRSRTLPNILILVADDAGGKDFGCYQHPFIKTPHIDRLAATGLKFTNAFLTSSSCSPSRTSILSGKYAHTIGTEDMHVPLPDSVRLLPSYLKQKNYYTGHMLKTHYGPAGGKQFDWHSNQLLRFTQFLDSAGTSPFFMWVGFNDPHRPYNSKTYKTRVEPDQVLVPPYLLDTPETRQDLADYYSEILRLDEQVGWMVAELERRGLRENTVIIFLSDNGSPFPGAKGTLYDTGIGTPLIVNWPAAIKSGQVYEGLVSSLDIAPTVLELAGLPKPGAMPGTSLGPVITGKGNYQRTYAFSERNWHGIDEHIRSVRTLEYKLITNAYESRPHGSPTDVTGSISWQNLLHAKDKLNAHQKRIFAYPRPKVELYDIRKDPHEMNNLAEKPEYKKIREELYTVLRQWQTTTRDVSVEAHLKKDKTDRFTGAAVE